MLVYSFSLKLKLLFLLVITSHYVLSQNKPITGYVFNDYGDALTGVNIISEPSKSGTQTNTDGQFSFFAPVNDRSLVFRYIGYEERRKNIVLFKNGDKIILKRALVVMDSLVVEENKIKHFDDKTEKNNISYIESQNLIQKGSSDLAEGIYFDQSVILNETINGRKTMSIRGSASNELTIFYDGVKINRLGDPIVDLSVFPTTSFTGVEILKGSHETALYSSGSINLIPKIEYRNSIFFKQQFGTYNYGGYDGVGSLGFKYASLNYGISESQYSQSYSDTSASDLNTVIKRNFFNIGLRNKKSFDLKFLGYNHKKEFINFRSNDSIDFNSNTYILKLSQFNIVNSQIFLYGMYQNQKGQESLNLYNRDKISENRELGFELFKHVKNADLRISSQTSFINFDWNIDSESVSTERQNSVLTGSFELNKPDREDVLFLKDIKLVLSNHRITDKSDTLKGINLPYHYWENNNFNFTMSFLKKTNQKRAFYYLNFSKTYRPPSLYDFLSNSTFSLYENQLDLEPEHKSTYEIGYRLNRVAVIGEASYDLNTSFFNYSYLNKMKNIIVEGTPAQFSVNSGAASIFGLDVKLELSPTVSWINFKFLLSNYYFSDFQSFPMQPDKIFKNIITLKTRWLNVDFINRNEGEKVLSTYSIDGEIIQNKLEPNIGFDCTVYQNINLRFIKSSISISGKNLLSKETSLGGISIYDKRYYLSLNVSI